MRLSWRAMLDQSIHSNLLVGRGERHQPGVYFGLDEDAYHADPSLGSGDVRRLRNVPYDWWWHSRNNPFRPPADKKPEKQGVDRGDALTIGSAMHLFVLQGREAFDRKFVCRPHDVQRLTEKTAAKIAPQGQKILWEDDYYRIMISGSSLRNNPAMQNAFANGEPEVSVFWLCEFEGRSIPMKARFDYLKPRAVPDLKSIRNSRKIEFVEACRRAIGERRYDIQAAHYLEARKRLPALISAGAVYGDHDDDLLRRVHLANDYAFVLIFFQADDAPLSWGCILSPENPHIETARAHINQALSNYVMCAEAFGFDEPWLISNSLQELSEGDLPPWAWR